MPRDGSDATRVRGEWFTARVKSVVPINRLGTNPMVRWKFSRISVSVIPPPLGVISAAKEENFNGEFVEVVMPSRRLDAWGTRARA